MKPAAHASLNNIMRNTDNICSECALMKAELNTNDSEGFDG